MAALGIALFFLLITVASMAGRHGINLRIGAYMQGIERVAAMVAAASAPGTKPKSNRRRLIAGSFDPHDSS